MLPYRISSFLTVRREYSKVISTLWDAATKPSPPFPLVEHGHALDSHKPLLTQHHERRPCQKAKATWQNRPACRPSEVSTPHKGAWCGSPVPDAILTTPITYGAAAVAEALGVPLIILSATPWAPSTVICDPSPFCLQALGNDVDCIALCSAPILVWGHCGATGVGTSLGSRLGQAPARARHPGNSVAAATAPFPPNPCDTTSIVTSGTGQPYPIRAKPPQLCGFDDSAQRSEGLEGP
jgi:hypothetical protein